MFSLAVAATAFFAVCGFGATRLLLPEGLRRYELAWVIPVGACVSALALTVLGFAFVPLAENQSPPVELAAAWRDGADNPVVSRALALL